MVERTHNQLIVNESKTNLSHSPISQVTPENPSKQLQVKDVKPSVH